MSETSYHVDVLKAWLERKKTVSSLYSARSLAAFLEISPSVLSRVLNQKRNFAPRTVRRIIEKLKLPPLEASLFYASATSVRDPFTNIRFNGMLKEALNLGLRLWHYYKKTSFTLIDKGQNNPEVISKIFGTSTKEVIKFTECLESSGLLARDSKDSWKFVPNIPV